MKALSADSRAISLSLEGVGALPLPLPLPLLLESEAPGLRFLVVERAGVGLRVPDRRRLLLRLGCRALSALLLVEVVVVAAGLPVRRFFQSSSSRGLLLVSRWR